MHPPEHGTSSAPVSEGARHDLVVVENFSQELKEKVGR
jgi:hypothetical protein